MMRNIAKDTQKVWGERQESEENEVESKVEEKLNLFIHGAFVSCESPSSFSNVRKVERGKHKRLVVVVLLDASNSWSKQSKTL